MAKQEDNVGNPYHSPASIGKTSDSKLVLRIFGICCTAASFLLGLALFSVGLRWIYLFGLVGYPERAHHTSTILVLAPVVILLGFMLWGIAFFCYRRMVSKPAD